MVAAVEAKVNGVGDRLLRCGGFERPCRRWRRGHGCSFADKLTIEEDWSQSRPRGGRECIRGRGREI
jgi:hypothetical protein